MNHRNRKPGVSLLICILLIGSFLMLCTGVWKTTAYLVDFTLQKQIYIQNRYVIEGIMRWVIKWALFAWDDLDKNLQQHNEIAYAVNNWPTSIEHLKNCTINIIVQRNASDTLRIEIVLSKEKITILKAHCNFSRSKISPLSEHSFRVHDWYVGA